MSTERVGTGGTKEGAATGEVGEKAHGKLFVLLTGARVLEI